MPTAVFAEKEEKKKSSTFSLGYLISSPGFLPSSHKLLLNLID
jgi:hypothetical protein